MDPSLPVVAEELLQEIQKSFGETSQISDELLLAGTIESSLSYGITVWFGSITALDRKAVQRVAEVRLWDLRRPGSRLGGPPVGHPARVSKRQDGVSGGGQLGKTLHLLRLLSFLQLSSFCLLRVAQRRQPRVCAMEETVVLKECDVCAGEWAKQDPATV